MALAAQEWYVEPQVAFIYQIFCFHVLLALKVLFITVLLHTHVDVILGSCSTLLTIHTRPRAIREHQKYLLLVDLIMILSSGKRNRSYDNPLAGKRKLSKRSRTVILRVLLRE